MPREVISISPKMRTAISLLFDGTCRTQAAAADRASVSREHLSAVLHSAAGRAFIEREMRKNVTQAAMRASTRLHELVDSPAQSVAFDATRLSLGIAGIKPDETSRVAVSVDIKAGYILDLRSSPMLPRDVGGDMGGNDETPETLAISKGRRG
jgi:hypothetical protein